MVFSFTSCWMLRGDNICTPSCACCYFKELSHWKSIDNTVIFLQEQETVCDSCLKKSYDSTQNKNTFHTGGFGRTGWSGCWSIYLQTLFRAVTNDSKTTKPGSAKETGWNWLKLKTTDNSQKKQHGCWKTFFLLWLLMCTVKVMHNLCLSKQTCLYIYRFKFFGVIVVSIILLYMV